MTQLIEQVTGAIGNALSDWLLIPLLICAALYFTVRSRFVQFTLFGQMWRQLVSRSDVEKDGVSSWQAFMVSIASRVGTGNLAGVATAITLGGPGAVFWMWMIALLGASSAFVESTLAQLFKEKDGKGAFRGGPAYYIQKGLGQRWWSLTFAVLIAVTFGLAYNSVQSNTISEAFATSWHIEPMVTAICIAALTLFIIWGGLGSIVKFSQWAVPVMAVSYIVVALIIMALNFDQIGNVLTTIFKSAFGLDQAIGGTLGAALSMGIRRGLFSNEAGEGSAPNVAATANVSHPVKQGLVQALGVFTDTIIICSCTAFIILCSGVYTPGTEAQGISLTQQAIDSQFTWMPGVGTTFVSVAIFFFAFTSIVANYYYGETNVRLLISSRYGVLIYRLMVTAMVFIGGIANLSLVWSLADITMTLMAVCNLAAIVMLGKYAMRCLADYRRQLREGKNPQYHSSVNPEIADKTSCWPN